MNKTLKWVLIGLAIAVVVFFVAMSIIFMLGHVGMNGVYERDSWGMMPYRSGGYHMPFFGMMGGFGFFRLLLPLAVIGFAVYGLVRLVSGNGSNHHARHSAQTPPPVTGATERACVACGRPLPAEGEYCPHCGEKQ